MRKKSTTFVLAAMLLVLCGCHHMVKQQKQYRNSSVVDYLYPDTQHREVKASIPHLNLPLQVGIAFTPGTYGATVLTEAKKIELMTRLSKHFESLEFVSNIEIIPSHYLTTGGSFQNLDQLQRLFDIDVIALVSYDQTRFEDKSFASFSYWTIVGPYVVPSEKNSTHTMIDTVLYDIGSRKMLFRAAGTSSVKSTSTLVGQDRRTRKDGQRGFDRASETLATNLSVQLETFQEEVKRAPETVRIAHREGYSGSGSTGLSILLGAIFLVHSRFRR